MKSTTDSAPLAESGRPLTVSSSSPFLPKSPKSFKPAAVFKRFSLYTTLHGFPNIARSQGNVRRIVWIIITLFAFTSLLYQMGNSIELYLSRPVAFNVQRNYKSQLAFPAVTICNQNLFRISKAWREGLYEYLESMYDIGGPIDRHKVIYNITMVEVLSKMKHLKDDIFLTCKWNRVHDCTPLNFTETLVHDGVCYTFNSDNNNKLQTAITGSGSGFNILMNIEQYEFMRTNSLTAGIHVYIHDQNALPREMISIPPGMKAYIRVGYKHVQLLQSPYGVCGRQDLSGHEKYSMAACLSACQEEITIATCGCQTGLSLSYKNDSVPLCNIYQYATCVVPSMNKHVASATQCNCPIQCNFKSYETFMSFSQISTFDVNQAVKRLKNNTKSKMTRAREVFYRLNHDRRFATVNMTLGPFMNITDLMHDRMVDLHGKLISWRKEIRQFHQQINRRYNFNKYMLRRAVYAVKNNWLRGWQVAHERTFTLLTFDYTALLFSIGFLKGIKNNDDLNSKEFFVYRHILDARLNEKEKLCERALSNLTKIHDAFANSTNLLSYQVTPKRVYDHAFVPSSVVAHNLEREDELFNNLTHQIGNYLNALRLLRRDVQSLDSKSPKSRFNSKRYDRAKAFLRAVRKDKLRIAAACRKVNFLLYLYEDRIVRKALYYMNSRSTSFLDISKKTHDAFFKVSYRFRKIEELLIDLDHIYDRSLKNVLDITRNYINNPHTLKFNLSTLSFEVIQERLGKVVESFSSDVGSINVHNVAMQQDLWTLKRLLIKSAKLIFDDTLQKPYDALSKDVMSLCLGNQKRNRTHEWKEKKYAIYQMAGKSKGSVKCNDTITHTNSDWIKEGVETVTRRLKRRVEAFATASSSVDGIIQLKEDVLLNILRLNNFARVFQLENRISRKFVRDNFVELQLFYQDLVEIHETQSPAYTMTQLWSDFGGNFGLLLGASVLSVVEIIDFFVVDFLR